VLFLGSRPSGAFPRFYRLNANTNAAVVETAATSHGTHVGMRDIGDPAPGIVANGDLSTLAMSPAL
jgi:hypothetical protein